MSQPLRILLSAMVVIAAFAGCQPSAMRPSAVTASEGGGGGDAATREALMNATYEGNAVKTLSSSAVPRELARAAQELAVSAAPEDHAALLGFLRDPAFRGRLDPPGEDVAGADDLYLAWPIRSLALNRALVARETLRQLMVDQAFTDDEDRVDLLLAATEHWRPAEPAVIGFWRRAMDPDGAHAEIAVAVAAANASEPAAAFFGECLGDGRFSDEARIAWMRRQLLLHRTEESFLRAAEGLMLGESAGKLSPGLKVALAEALFDFRQQEWYPPHNPPRPPERARTSRAGRDILRRIAAFTTERLSPDRALRLAIEKTIKELDAMDKAKAP